MRSICSVVVILSFSHTIPVQTVDDSKIVRNTVYLFHARQTTFMQIRERIHIIQPNRIRYFVPSHRKRAQKSLGAYMNSSCQTHANQWNQKAYSHHNTPNTTIMKQISFRFPRQQQGAVCCALSPVIITMKPFCIDTIVTVAARILYVLNRIYDYGCDARKSNVIQFFALCFHKEKFD